LPYRSVAEQRRRRCFAKRQAQQGVEREAAARRGADVQRRFPLGNRHAQRRRHGNVRRRRCERVVQQVAHLRRRRALTAEFEGATAQHPRDEDRRRLHQHHRRDHVAPVRRALAVERRARRQKLTALAEP
jgi:hypothetical protein